MRNIKLALLLGVGWGIAVAGGSNEKRSRTIQMKGCVTNYGKMLPGVTIVLYEDGLVTKSIETLDNGKFTFELMWDKCYILEFHKVSHVPKRVRVSTILIDNTISDLSYEFDVELIETWKFEGVNTAVFIRPMAKIAYNSRHSKFDYDRKHTHRMKTTERNLLHGSFLIRVFNDGELVY